MPILELSRNERLFRLVRTEYSDPAYFGREATYRFDARDGSYGVCYLGTTLDCCFLEVLSAERDPHTQRLFVTMAALRGYYAATAHLQRPLRLAYLADDGLAHIGIDQRVTGGDDYRLSQIWGQAVHGHESMVDGLFYATRHHNRLYAVALFERARNAVEFTRWGVLSDQGDKTLWDETTRIAERFGLDMVAAL